LCVPSRVMAATASDRRASSSQGWPSGPGFKVRSRSRSTPSWITSEKLPRPVTFGSSRLPSTWTQPSPSSCATNGFSTSSSSHPISDSFAGIGCSARQFHPFSSVFIRFQSPFPHPVEGAPSCAFQLQQAVTLHPFQQILGLPLTKAAQIHHFGTPNLPVLTHIVEHHLLVLD